VELQYVPGTGLAGRIAHADLDAFLARDHAPAAPQAGGADARYAKREDVDDLKIIGLRRRIAAQMQEAKRRIPHFMYAEEVDVTELEELRAHLNATKAKDQPKLTLLPFMIRALCKALPAYPNINARFDDEAGVLHRSGAVHLGMATQTPNGLIVPVIRHAETMDVWALATEVARLAKATKEGTARKDELSGSTITLTSLGPLGGVTHTPVINHPETAIVGPNKIVERPVVRAGAIAVRKMMNVSSSFDHRVVDGYDAAEFIQQVKGLLEHPATLFM
ncbi:MAG: 2-oxo acid dehydrogenase subunit E2, partial [Caulobacteraceae bacterium]|nr:2-oxo acid dehydrogenase subunit E2 [Caulobacter sp.]